MIDKVARRYLFVCGTPRSGTTETCNLLNVHPDILIGIERYKYIYNQPERAAEIGSQLFEPARFSDFRATDSNIGLKHYRTAGDLAQHSAAATVAGDKLPRFYAQYERMAAAFPGARFVYMLRDPVRVASSWQVRADRDSDSWPKANDSRRAVEEWNRANELTLAFARAHPGRLAVVPYEALFSGDHETLVQLMVWIGVGADKSVLRYYRQTCAPRARTLGKKRLALAPGQEAEINAAARADLVAELQPFTIGRIAATVDLREQRRKQRQNAAKIDV
jgi:hypothetical protein